MNVSWFDWIVSKLRKPTNKPINNHKTLTQSKVSSNPTNLLFNIPF